MNKIIVIVGPTGVGKTKLSIELAKIYNGEIINADSTQIYKGLDIATAKIKEEEKEGIPHRLFDIRDIKENYTVYDYQKDCRDAIKKIQELGKTPIIVGGTGLYLKAALYDYQFNEEGENNSYDDIDTNILYQELVNVDPNTTIHPNNRKRIIRALNYYHLNNKPMSAKEKASTLLYDCLFIGLTTNREILYSLINKRVEVMVRQGLLEEARRIYDSNIRTKAIMTPIGYKELFPYFEGKETLENCLEKIKQSSRRYAKRQYTWFNNQMEVKWFNVDFANFNNTVKEIEYYINKEIS